MLLYFGVYTVPGPCTVVLPRQDIPLDAGVGRFPRSLTTWLEEEIRGRITGLILTSLQGNDNPPTYKLHFGVETAPMADDVIQHKQIYFDFKHIDKGGETYVRAVCRRTALTVSEFVAQSLSVVA